ncbi:MAG TPA: class I SAM-dependent methyltransferase [Gemmatimonadaceae bacterium]|nr:class I SAM-dependent methyltransferase [Gemmatimonadaceae bacterium]
MLRRLRSLLRPAPGHELAHRLRRLTSPIWLGSLGRTAPTSDAWGFDRGTPVDRYYIERFLEANRGAVRGRALEIQDRLYTERFGTGVEKSDVLDIDATNPRATVVADLAAADHLPSESYDVLIVTQTLHLIRDTRAAIAQVHRLLAPGGVLLATLPTVSRISRGVGVQGDYWRFTVASASWLFGDVFGAPAVTVAARGNVLSAIAFLSGLAAEELPARDLDVDDPYFPVVITVRATKALAGG